jgi:hypothetical protein
VLMNVIEAPGKPRPDFIWEEFEDGYFDLPFHNKLHPRLVNLVARDLVTLCLKQGIKLDDEVIDYVTLGHDLNFPYPLDQNKLDVVPDKEVRSANEATNRIRKMITGGKLPTFTRTKIMPIRSGIKRTHYKFPVVTDEDRVENRADVDNGGQDYIEEMIPNSAKLLVERRYLCEEEIPFERWLGETTMVLGGYADKGLSLGEFDVNKQGRLWVAQFDTNRFALANETEASLREKAGEDFVAELEDKYPAGEGYRLYSRAA